MTEQQTGSGLIVNPEPDTIRRPDSRWRRFAPTILAPPMGFGKSEDGEVHSQEVTVTNTASNQIHVVIDRHYVGHELRPGQSKRLDLLVDDIRNFKRLAQSGRTNIFGEPIIPHPIRITDLSDRSVLGEQHRPQAGGSQEQNGGGGEQQGEQRGRRR